MSWKAAKTSALLSLLFLVVYGGINRLTGLRPDVGTCFGEWERIIPFVPAMIIPYMSIDLFFIAAPFVCRDDRQRIILSRRIIATILIAGACFLLFPMRFAFDRPHVDGPLGIIFNNFRLLDQPYNLFPSLHIALQIILLPIYVQHTRGLFRAGVSIWFALIAASTVLTYQHHVVDVLGGAMLGAMCLHIFREDRTGQMTVRNRRIGIYYLLGAIGCIMGAIISRPWGLLALWPAMSLALVSTGYFGVNAAVYGKQDGRLSAIARILLWPVLLGQRISLAYYARQAHPWDALTDDLWIGRQLSSVEAQHATESGVRAVLDLSPEFSEARPFRAVAYQHLPILDLTAPTQRQLDQAIAFVRAHVDCGTIVYVHCKAGYSRTAAVAGAYLLANGDANCVHDAVAKLRTARPRIVIRREAMNALHEYAARLRVRARSSPVRYVPLELAAAPSTR